MNEYFPEVFLTLGEPNNDEPAIEWAARMYFARHNRDDRWHCLQVRLTPVSFAACTLTGV
jgi:hypothetical protein